METSSARFAEAAAEAARVGMLDETRQASREAEAKQAAELAVETEWQAYVEALLEAQAELERLAAEAHIDAEERQRAAGEGAPQAKARRRRKRAAGESAPQAKSSAQRRGSGGSAPGII